jgi:DNA-directed RNA polymerase subunit alpha
VEEAFDVLTALKSNKVASYFLGKCYQEREEYEKALECFERSKHANEDEFEIEVNIAETQRLSGDSQSALKMIQKLSKGHDDDANLHYQWAHCLDNLGAEKMKRHWNTMKNVWKRFRYTPMP